MSDQVGNPEDRFSHEEAQFMTGNFSSSDMGAIKIISEDDNKLPCIAMDNKNNKKRYDT